MSVVNFLRVWGRGSWSFTSIAALLINQLNSLPSQVRPESCWSGRSPTGKDGYVMADLHGPDHDLM
jgi:hypothetical protein